jgi:hypothetical protein
MAKKQKETKPQGFSPNVMLMVGGLQKFVEDNNYSVEQARMFYSIIKASLQDSFNTWAETHTIADLPIVNTIEKYDKKEDVSDLFKGLKGDIIQFIEQQARTANVENFMLAINETATELDNKVIISRQNEEAKNYK